MAVCQDAIAIRFDQEFAWRARATIMFLPGGYPIPPSTYRVPLPATNRHEIPMPQFPPQRAPEFDRIPTCK